MPEKRAPRNRTVQLSEEDMKTLRPQLKSLDALASPLQPDLVLKASMEDCLEHLQEESIDLLFLDPPYNLNKKYDNLNFYKSSIEAYTQWLDGWFCKLIPCLKPTASVYVCGDWLTSVSLFEVINRHLIVRNRITWEREKGRGAKTNFKNSHEDIWFATVSDDYTFNLDDIKMKRQVIAPYKVKGKPKDWEESKDGNFRMTHPSNLWTDLSVPFWSMPENTDHPTQKPEKLLAKCILASTQEGDVILDPFAGSGTTAVVARKLNRRFIVIEQSEEYNFYCLKRLQMADKDQSIQGYEDGVFWERNSLKAKKSK